MGGYLVNFSLYTLAMVGIIFCALFVFKAVMSGKGFSKKSEFLKVEDSMNLSPRKTIYVIKAGEEKFLVASDIDRTSLIAKLDEKSETELKLVRQDKSEELSSFDGIESIDDFASVLNFKKDEEKRPVIKELARKLSMI